MARPDTAIGDKIREYLAKYKSTSKLGIAKLLHRDFPLLYKSIEQARSNIRSITGSNGKMDREKRSVILEHNSTHTRENPYGLPHSDYEESPPFVIPPSVKDLLVGSDFHFLFQDNRAIAKWLDYGIGNKCGGILLNGDLMDMYQVSRFLKTPKVGDIQREFEEVRKFLEMLRNKFPNVPIYFKEGNHEERWELNLRTNAPMLFDMEEFQLATILRLAELNVDFITDKRVVKYSGLNIIHGHEVPFASSANGARALYLKTGVSTLASHVHRTSEHVDKNLDGKITGCWTIGCLSGLNPEYALRSNKYNHGWAHVVRDADHFAVKNIKLIDYKIL
jgi:hypothetical protein